MREGGRRARADGLRSEDEMWKVRRSAVYKEVSGVQKDIEAKEAAQADEPTLEEAFARLDEMLERMEDRELPLEESFRLYQQGMELLAKCNEKIDTVEKKILMMNGDGGLDEF